jgi:hypothetical protein
MNINGVFPMMCGPFKIPSVFTANKLFDAVLVPEKNTVP